MVFLVQRWRYFLVFRTNIRTPFLVLGVFADKHTTTELLLTTKDQKRSMV